MLFIACIPLGLVADLCYRRFKPRTIAVACAVSHFRELRTIVSIVFNQLGQTLYKKPGASLTKAL